MWITYNNNSHWFTVSTFLESSKCENSFSRQQTVDLSTLHFIYILTNTCGVVLVLILILILTNGESFTCSKWFVTVCYINSQCDCCCRDYFRRQTTTTTTVFIQQYSVLLKYFLCRMSQSLESFDWQMHSYFLYYLLYY